MGLVILRSAWRATIALTPLAALCIAAEFPDDPDFELQWFLHNTGQVVDNRPGVPEADVDALGAWDIHGGSLPVVVAIVGRGIDPHPEFADRLLEGHATIGDPFDTLDSCPHDTHLAGIIAAAVNDSVGISGLQGSALVLPVRVFDGCGGTASEVAEGIVWAADQGADIIVVPIRFDEPSQELFSALQHAAGLDALVIGSVGSIGAATVGFPAAYEECLAVSATTNQDEFSAVSNYGPEVDLAAPGRGIWSTWTDGGHAYLGDGRDTAAAAACVAGVAALVRSYAPQLSAKEIRQVLIDSADDLGDPGWDVRFGAGRVNARRALELAPPPALRFEHPQPLPEFVASDRPHSVTLRIASVSETLDAATAQLRYQIDGGDEAQTPLESLGSEMFGVDLPPLPCESTLDYYFYAESEGGTLVTDPLAGPSESHTLQAVVHEVLFVDDFESDTGWTTEGGDNTSGAWSRVIPVGTSAQPDYDASPDAGRSCFVTGQHFGGSDGNNDVDGGPVTLISPIVELATDDAEVFFATWVFSANGTPDALVIQLSRNGGIDWVDVDTVPSTGEWVWRSFRLSEFPEITGNELRVRFSIADVPNDSLTEAAIDEFLVRAIHCTFALGDANLDGIVDLLDWKELVSCLSGPATSSLPQPCPRSDFDLNSTIDLRDVGAFQNAVDSP